MCFLHDMISMINPNHPRVMVVLESPEWHVAYLLVIYLGDSLMTSFVSRSRFFLVRVDDFHASEGILDHIKHPNFIQSPSDSLECVNEVLKQYMCYSWVVKAHFCNNLRGGSFSNSLILLSSSRIGKWKLLVLKLTSRRCPCFSFGHNHNNYGLKPYMNDVESPSAWIWASLRSKILRATLFPQHRYWNYSFFWH